MACLGVKNEQELIKYYTKLVDAGASVVLFREPDRNNEATSLAFLGTPDLRKITSSLPLLLKKQQAYACI